MSTCVSLVDADEEIRRLIVKRAVSLDNHPCKISSLESLVSELAL